MKKEKKILIKNFKYVIEDLLDNYDKYTAEDKEKVKQIFKKVAELNAVLDKYDVAPVAKKSATEKHAEREKTIWVEYLTIYNSYFEVADNQ